MTFVWNPLSMILVVNPFLDGTGGQKGLEVLGVRKVMKIWGQSDSNAAHWCGQKKNMDNILQSQQSYNFTQLKGLGTPT